MAVFKMNEYFIGLLGLAGPLLGYFAKPLQDWYSAKLTRTGKIHTKREEIIEEAFMLLSAVDEKLRQAGNVISAQVISPNLLKTDQNSELTEFAKRVLFQAYLDS